MALFAVIASFETEQEERDYLRQRSDRDLSHVLMRTRAWWHDLFSQTGWRQDPVHRVAARACQEHDLPKRMGWKVYLYAPQ